MEKWKLFETYLTSESRKFSIIILYLLSNLPETLKLTARKRTWKWMFGIIYLGNRLKCLHWSQEPSDPHGWYVRWVLRKPLLHWRNPQTKPRVTVGAWHSGPKPRSSWVAWFFCQESLLAVGFTTIFEYLFLSGSLRMNFQPAFCYHPFFHLRLRECSEAIAAVGRFLKMWPSKVC